MASNTRFWQEQIASVLVIYPAPDNIDANFSHQKQIHLLKNTRPEGLEVVHAEVVTAVQRVDDRPVKALGNRHGHEGLVHEFVEWQLP